MENNGEKNCKSCKYYLEHYIKRNARLHAIGGHCINEKLYRYKPEKAHVQRENCEYWESNANKKSERRERIKETLREMNEQLRQISLILQNDEN